MFSQASAELRHLSRTLAKVVASAWRRHSAARSMYICSGVIEFSLRPSAVASALRPFLCTVAGCFACVLQSRVRQMMFAFAPTFGGGAFDKQFVKFSPQYLTAIK